MMITGHMPSPAKGIATPIAAIYGSLYGLGFMFGFGNVLFANANPTVVAAVTGGVILLSGWAAVKIATELDRTTLVPQAIRIVIRAGLRLGLIVGVAAGLMFIIVPISLPVGAVIGPIAGLLMGQGLLVLRLMSRIISRIAMLLSPPLGLVTGILAGIVLGWIMYVVGSWISLSIPPG